MRQRDKRYPQLSRFLDRVEQGEVSIIDPDLSKERPRGIVKKWSRVFDDGEVASGALAAERNWPLLTVDRGPAQQFTLSEGVNARSTKDVLDSLVRQKAIPKAKAAAILEEVRRSSRRR